MYVIETKGLNHFYAKDAQILFDVALQVPKGSIYGFLGPNGAGKTTTLQLVLGLIRNQSGEILLFGEKLGDDRISILQRIGSMIETPSIYDHLTAYENLLILQKIYSCPKAQINIVLDLVGLLNTPGKKVRQFSLGMKQRLAIAIAMLHNPSLLVLDEPTNGLDPAGIIEMRELLTRISQEQGTSILISSHLLPEIDKLVTHVGIINRGKLLFQGRIEDLRNRHQNEWKLILDTDDNDVVIQLPFIAERQPIREVGKIVLHVSSRQEVSFINQKLIGNGYQVYELSLANHDLESVFMKIINA